MKRFVHPSPSQWPEIVDRPARAIDDIQTDVEHIVETVRRGGDEAVRAFTRRFDGVDIGVLQVSDEEIAAAESLLAPDLIRAIDVASKNIEAFHAAQTEEIVTLETMPGVECWRRSVPIQSVGLYIPGGTAPLFSTVLMLGIPARVAGCEDVVVCTPPGTDGKVRPEILFAARAVGATAVFRVGGAQAIAALAFGTESIPRVDKIVGPGNRWVTAAKQIVQLGGTAVDMPAGPTEVAIIADESAVPAFVATDVLSQAEHGTDSHVLLITTSTELADAVMLQIEQLVSDLPRRDFARASLSESACVVVEDTDTALRLSDAYAPEHLIVVTRDAERLASRVRHAGSVFVGPFSPEAVGDYASGTNHTLPTGGYARAYSGLSTDSFVKKITFQRLSPEGLRNIGSHVEAMATAEGLDAHRAAVRIRLDSLEQAS
jgi:histidinol dehydrogenase